MLANRCKEHYKSQFLSQIYMVFFSLELLGNPVGLLNDVSAGVTDLFYLPAQVRRALASLRSRFSCPPHGKSPANVKRPRFV